MVDLEAKVLSAVLNDKQIHVLFQANPDSLFRTHKDVWDFVKNYYEQNSNVPTQSLLVEKFRDFQPVGEIGSTKHHLEELRTKYLEDNLRNVLMSSAKQLNDNQPVEALNTIISKTSELKRIIFFFLTKP